MKRKILICSLCAGLVLSLAACQKNAEDDNEAEVNQAHVQTETTVTEQETTAEGKRAEMKMNVSVGNDTFTATLEDNEAVKELIQMMKDGPVRIKMRDYSGFEKVGSLGQSLTTSDRQLTTQPGDIVLYNGNNIVMFYGSNSWSYTRIGKIDDLSNWMEAMGNGDITAEFAFGE